eukprot:CAMPEP_0203919284 /NCGR_PEP_ID=MMETSP0359-20131031/59741_1 /ASSEMBLY_ACC=CAM_ASM_000338 /TAXON_ID=268821 /ORGANISM="Scrippsiella Hangoei, Strain SHTV-5" /LENGTH=51 /DNA_ID=CAMNT_0050846553 /DNA_START=1 /DNA_END=153 /DNA_ORIENTATION=+
MPCLVVAEGQQPSAVHVKSARAAPQMRACRRTLPSARRGPRHNSSGSVQTL